MFDPGNLELCWCTMLRLFALEDNFCGRVGIKIPGRISCSIVRDVLHCVHPDVRGCCLEQCDYTVGKWVIESLKDRPSLNDFCNLCEK